MRRREGDYDAVIVGGGIGGLVAAAYLARGKARVLLLESRDRFGGCAETIEFAEGFRAPLMHHVAYALDGRAVRELRLIENGLDVVQSNMKFVALRPGGGHIALPGTGLRGSAAIAESGAEGCDYATFRHKAMGFARLLRPLWDGRLADPGMESRDDAVAAILRCLQLGPRKSEGFEILLRLSAAAFLDGWLENDALKAALAFDVFPSGLAPDEAGSSLALMWRYAQESCGRQAAVSQIRGGPDALARTLQTAAKQAGAELRSSAHVGSIIVERRRAKGVTLTTGEMIGAGVVLSSLDLQETLSLVEPSPIGVGASANGCAHQTIATAQVMLALNGLPPFAGLAPEDFRARMVIVDRAEIASEAKGAALNGQVSSELALELTIPTAADPSLAPAGCHVLSALIPYMPTIIAGGWEAPRMMLHKQVLAALEGFAPGLRNRVLAYRVIAPEDANAAGLKAQSKSSPGRLLASYEARIRTPIAGLYLCGGSAEPVSAFSGRAGRLAASLAFMGDRRMDASR
jgi:phytoene dehydrogenase-like protein